MLAPTGTPIGTHIKTHPLKIHTKYQAKPKGSPKGNFQWDSQKNSQKRVRANNKEQLIVWLTHYNNRFGSSGREGLINLQALPKPGPSWGPLDYAENIERLEKNDQYQTDKLIMEIIEKMRVAKWELYMILMCPYLDPDGSPAIVEKWRLGKEAGSVGAKLQFDMHEDAIEWILDQVPENRTLVTSPKLQVARGDLDAARQRRRQRARLLFFSYEEKHGTEEAVRRVMKEEGYSRKEVYRIIKNRPKKKKKKK